MNPTLKLIHNRTSLRLYKDCPISEEHLQTLLAATLKAPTAGNMMLYSVLVIRNEEMQKTLSKTCDNQPFIAKAPLILVFLADYQRWFDYFHLSNVDDFCQKSGYTWQGPDVGDLFLAINDALIAAQTAVLAGESLGIGSCYIGDVMENYETHQELLDLPEYVFPAAMLCLGYYPDQYKRKFRERFPEEHLVYYEQYQRQQEDDLQRMFAQLEDGFSAKNSFGAKNMGQFMFARKTGSELICSRNESFDSGRFRKLARKRI